MHAFVVSGLVFHTICKTASPKWPISCWVGCKTLTYSLTASLCYVH